MDAALRDLFEYLEEGVSPFHGVAATARRLEEAGFEKLEEGRLWALKPGGRYYLTRNGSSLIAFWLPEQGPRSWRMSAAHSDSPTFRVKKWEGRSLAGWQRLAVEGYGGLNLPSWLDRPLGLAGRVLVRTPKGIEPRLVRSEGAVCVIPSLCVHFDEAHGKGRALAPASDLQPVWAAEGSPSPADWLADRLGVEKEAVLDGDLTLFPLQPPTLLGESGLFLSPRIDDLESAWACLRGFLAGQPGPYTGRLFCLFDNEEVGSSTRQGAESGFLSQVLERIGEALGRSRQQSAAALAASLLLSADNGHAAHPNHLDRADPENPVILGKGLLLKYSANQRYTTSGLTGALAGEIFRRAGVPVQRFTNRADLPGGSTLGNLLGHTVSLPMADVGAPQWAMHSCVETAHAGDALALLKGLKAFYASEFVLEGDGSYQLK